MGRLWQTTTSDFPARDQNKKRPKPSWRALFRATAAAQIIGREDWGDGSLWPAASLWPPTWREPLKHWTALAAIGVIAAAAFVPAKAADISGAGATFPYPIYAKWADEYKKVTGNGLNYQSIGSGGGIKQIKAKTVTFGASDAPLPGKELDEAGLAQFPMVMGGIVPVVNLDGVKPGDLTIDGPTLAKIFLGDIKTWDDPAIKKLNPSVKLPNQAIAIVHRSDGSGTTYNFAYYLADVSADWKSKVGVNTSVQWPSGIGAKGNEGVANNVGNTKGSIGYVEYAYAKQNKLTFTKMVNKAGKTVAPTSDAFQAAAANADWKSQPGYGVILGNQPGDKSWPMTAATWILVYKQPSDIAATGEALKFFAWAYKNGGKAAEELDYVPMPANVVTDIEKSWATDIRDASGKPIFAMTN
jgi:phosphate transport system substrate-binding protein